ncbi:cell growth-regulating nucleolar protein [Euwallacea fornicatus]|uniref:cell growth-regulating nucleolar protein n=1 Tax=Euwallacea fornicatus TaxID=995702 RepID=UPI00338E21D0
MVVFTCNHCGETLHKPKVEKHYQFQCRNYKSLSCVDCLKDFRNDEYNVHTKCLTENERYAAKGTYKNGIVNKGDVKQDNWLQMIQSICVYEKNLKPSLRQLLETISEYSNVPRKRAKFLNFIKSSSGNRANMREVEEIWDIIEKYKNQTSLTKNVENKQKNDNVKKRILEDESDSLGSKKKPKASTQNESKAEQSHENGNTDASAEATKFKYKEKVLEILAEKQDISLKKLQKKILKQYINTTGLSDCEEKVVKKLNKKLSKIPNISIEDDRVKLLN